MSNERLRWGASRTGAFACCLQVVCAARVHVSCCLHTAHAGGVTLTRADTKQVPKRCSIMALLLPKSTQSESLELQIKTERTRWMCDLDSVITFSVFTPIIIFRFCTPKWLLGVFEIKAAKNRRGIASVPVKNRDKLWTSNNVNVSVM